MTHPQTMMFKPSPFTKIAPEIHGLIADNLNHHDLETLSRTCKTIKTAVLPKLYKKVYIKVPQKWSRLPSLEGLLASTGDGLKYTKELFIQTQQDPLKDSQQGSENRRPLAESRAQTKLQFSLPQSSASDALNTLIRLLIVKLPQNRLDEFHWEHCCEVDVLTLNLLFERQVSLQVLFCNRYSSACNISGSVKGGLCSLSVDSMTHEGFGCQWAAKMIAKNADTLHHLSLGFTTRIARDFAHGRDSPYSGISSSFAICLRDTLSKSDLEPLIHLSLKSLSLGGFDLGAVVRGETPLNIDFRNITKLRLVSCSGLSQAISLFTGQADSSKLALGALQDLFVRLEDPDPHFSNSLESLLMSVRGLMHLQVLMEKLPAVQNFEPILKIHGKTLSTLVWEERTGPRTRFDVSTSQVSANYGQLKAISRHCPSLTLLGITLDWDSISSSDNRVQGEIRDYFRKMSCLEVLNVRNLPQSNTRLAMPHVEYLVKGLAAMLVDIVNKNRESTLLKIVALGAPLYKDVHIGTHHMTHTPISDFMRFRVYSIDYKYPSPNGSSTVLSEVVSGAAVSADEPFRHTWLLNDYWLG